jgi:hypothetical protein
MSLGYKFSWTEMDLLSQNWNDFAKKHDGEFKVINVRSAANFSDPTLRKFLLEIPYLDGQITFLTTETKPLKVSYSFPKTLTHEFLIYNEDFTDKILKHFGLQEIEIGDPVFDKNFIIKGNNEIFMRKILSTELKAFLLENSIANFKLEKVEEGSSLELNIAINELEVSNLTKILERFKDCISMITGKNNVS